MEGLSEKIEELMEKMEELRDEYDVIVSAVQEFSEKIEELSEQIDGLAEEVLTEEEKEQGRLAEEKWRRDEEEQIRLEVEREFALEPANRRKAILKTNCKISGADCPFNIRFDSWGLVTLEDIEKWDEKVITHCEKCPNNIDMRKAVNIEKLTEEEKEQRRLEVKRQVAEEQKWFFKSKNII
jgi:chromosome segregation ATPase